jgi:hypothetical protein
LQRKELNSLRRPAGSSTAGGHLPASQSYPEEEVVETNYLPAKPLLRKKFSSGKKAG